MRPAPLHREGSTSPIVALTAWRLVWTDPARRSLSSPPRPASALGY